LGTKVDIALAFCRGKLNGVLWVWENLWELLVMDFGMLLWVLEVILGFRSPFLEDLITGEIGLQPSVHLLLAHG
jgi:hypothetical protein